MDDVKFKNKTISLLGYALGFITGIRMVNEDDKLQDQIENCETFFKKELEELMKEFE